MRSCVTFFNGRPWEHVLNEPGTFDIATTHGIRSTQHGPAYYGLNETNADQGVFFKKHDEFYNGVSALTALCLARNDKKTTDTWAGLEFPWCHGGSGNDGWTLRYNTGNPRFSMYNSTPTQYAVEYDLTGTDYESDQWLVTGGYWDDVNNEVVCRVMYDQTAPEATTGNPSIDPDAGQTPWVGTSAGGASQSWQGDVALGCYWERVLSQEEWNSMVDNPWQIFQSKVEVYDLVVPVVITDVDGDETWDDGSTGLVITGTGLI